MKHTNSAAEHQTPTPDRRTKLRLRELCEEVLASYHQARGRDLFSKEDREAARKLTVSVVSRC